MASFNKTIITNNGRSLIAKVLSGDQIKFTKMVSSSRDYTSSDLIQLTDLSNVEQTIVISSIKKTSDSAVKITGIFSNKDLKTGYKFKTVGLYAIDPDLGEILYSVTTASSVDDMPANTGIGLSSITIGLVTDVSNSNNASLEVSDVATVSALEFNEFKDEVNSHLNEIANKNLIINGGPLIWQRSTSLVDLQDFCADRWEYICWVNSGPSGKIEKDIDGSMKISQLNSDGNYVRQLIESSISSQLANQKLTLSADIKAINATTGNAFIQLVFSDGVDTLDGSSTHKELIIPSTNLTSDYQRFVLTLDVPGTTNTVAVQIGCHHSNGGVLNTDCILNIKNIKLEIGEKATPFKSELYADTLIRCMRYFQFMRCNWIAYSSNILWCANGNYFVPMRVIPTVTPDSNILDHFGGGNQNITGKFTYAGITKESLFYIESSAQEFIPGDKYSGFMRLDSEIR